MSVALYSYTGMYREAHMFTYNTWTCRERERERGRGRERERIYYY